MKKKISLTCMALLCFITGTFAQLTEINWQPTLLEIDGNPNDWTTNLRFFDSESKIKYEFRNDAVNLYFVFKSDEKSLQRQLQQAGMKLKFAVKSNAKTTGTITFAPKKGMQGMPMPPMNGGQGQQPPMQQGQKPELAQNQQSGLDQFAMRPEFSPKDTATIKGFLFAKDRIFSDNSTENTIRFAKSRGNMEEAAFELVIPIRELFGDGYKLETISNIPIQFQLSINSVSQNTGSGEMRGGPGRMGGMGGGPGMGGPGGGSPDGGGPRGPGGGGEMGERPEMPEGMNANQDSMTQKSLKALFHLTKEQ